MLFEGWVQIYSMALDGQREAGTGRVWSVCVSLSTLPCMRSSIRRAAAVKIELLACVRLRCALTSKVAKIGTKRAFHFDETS